MLEGRRRLMIPGLLAVLTFTVALISATALTGAENTLPTRVFGSILSALALAAGLVSLALALRGVVRQALTGLGSRMQKQTKRLLEDHDRRQADLVEQLNLVEERSREMLGKIGRDVQEVRTAIGSLRERDEENSKALGNRFDEIDRAQRRVMNFLRREGNIQIILDRLQASERRLLSSVESGALTTSAELSRSVDHSHSELREWLRTEVLDGGALRAELSTISHGIDAAGARVDALDATANEIARRVEALASVVDRASIENSKAFEGLGEETARAADSSASTKQEVSLVHEKIRPLFKELADSQAANEGLATSIRSDLNDLVDRWNARQEGRNDAQTDMAGHEGNDTSVKTELGSLVHLTDVLKNDVKALHRHVDRAGIETVRQTEALMQLLPRVNAETRRLPASGGFAMTPDSLLLLSDLIEFHRPELILELGSGTSTVWLGTFAKKIGASVVSIDHLEEYRARTQEDLDEFGLSDAVEVRLAELSPVEVGEVTSNWYDTKTLQDLSSIGLVVVDGPPESTGQDPRNPAFPVLRSRLADHALVVVDDIHREQEQQMVTRWIELDSDLRRTNWSSSRTMVLEYRRSSNLA